MMNNYDLYKNMTYLLTSYLFLSVRELSKLGTYGGNDSIVAFARNNGLDIVIHQLNNPRWVIHGSEYSKTPEIIELHLAYHNGEHYSSVRSLSDPGDGPAWQYNKKNMTQPMVCFVIILYILRMT